MSFWLRHPIVVGVGAGIAVSVTAAFLASQAELQAGGSRVFVCGVVALFFGPASNATCCVARILDDDERGRVLLRVFWCLPLAVLASSSLKVADFQALGEGGI